MPSEKDPYSFDVLFIDYKCRDEVCEVKKGKTENVRKDVFKHIRNKLNTLKLTTELVE